MPKVALEALCASKEAFLATLAPIYEKSPWVAERAYASAPFASVTALAAAMKDVVAAATDAEVVALLRAHPDLAGRAALAGELTAESAVEQQRAGLGSLTPGELAEFRRLNAAYREAFGWPFILAVRNASKRAVLAAFERRVGATAAGERAECVAQVHKIAWMRLLDAVAHKPAGFLTCHVLDTAHGCPAAGMAVSLRRVGDHGDLPAEYAFVTNADGRLDGPALKGDAFAAGAYEWTFRVGEYFAAAGVPVAARPFLGDVPIRFGIDNPEEHYHVPLLCSPWTFSTYRGS